MLSNFPSLSNDEVGEGESDSSVMTVDTFAMQFLFNNGYLLPIEYLIREDEQLNWLIITGYQSIMIIGRHMYV